MRLAKAILTRSFLLMFILSTSGLTYAQSLVDGFMKGKGHGSVVVSYSWERYDQFYFADEKRDAPAPFGGEITTQSVSLYGAIGISDDLDVVLNVPYVNAQGDAAEMAGAPDQSVGGLQDLEVALKWRPLVLESDLGKLSFLASAGFGTPLSDYAANAVLSIGNQATRFDGRLITQYQSSVGIFAELQAGQSFRSNDVPNATLLLAKVGYAGSFFYVDLWSSTQISDSDAPDINPAEVPFNETRVNFTQIGASVYVPIISSLGVSAGVARYVSGRNVGLSTRLSAGVVYNF